jgi:hypothetical protein
MRSLIIWLVGVILCVVVVYVLLPRGGPPGNQWIYPLGVRGTLYFARICCPILVVTYLVDKCWPKGGNSN